MIAGYSDHTLRDLWLTGQAGRFRPALAKLLLAYLDVMDAASSIEELRAVPGCNLTQPLAGAHDMFVIEISPSWRLSFRYAHSVFLGLIAKHLGSAEALPPDTTVASVPRMRKPTPPGEILRAFFLEPLHMNQTELADHINSYRTRPNAILKSDRPITTDTALRLAHAFGTTPDFWLKLQTRYNLWQEIEKQGDVYQQIKRIERRAVGMVEIESKDAIPSAADVESENVVRLVPYVRSVTLKPA